MTVEIVKKYEEYDEICEKYEETCRNMWKT